MAREKYNPEINAYGEKKNNTFILGPEYSERKVIPVETDPNFVQVAGVEIYVPEDDPRAMESLPTLKLLESEEARAGK